MAPTGLLGRLAEAGCSNAFPRPAGQCLESVGCIVWRGVKGTAAGRVGGREHLLLELGTETNLFVALVLGSGAKLDLDTPQR